MTYQSNDPAAVLPENPSIERLRKDAKALHKKMRVAAPGARLADAQLSIARAYGFASWRRLKRYVDAVNDIGARLVDAVRRGDLAAMEEILAVHPELVDATVDMEERIRPSDEKAMRLIHLAVAENQVRAADMLVRFGANINLRNANGRTPLHDCFELHRPRIHAILMEAGARIDACIAAAYGMIDALDALLAANPGEANDLSTGLSPLGWAGYGGRADSVDILIKHGAFVDNDPYDYHAWFPASDVAASDVAAKLVESGANPNFQDAQGNTPMHRAIMSRIVEDPADFIATMLACGASPTIQNSEGHTPLQEASQRRQTIAETYYPRKKLGVKRLDTVIALLREAGG